jgi:transcriptional regulator with XRE-family HTH domain
MTIGERLKRERKRLHLSQGDLAKVGGIHYKSQANYESDVRAPDTDYLTKIAAFGIDIGFIILGARAFNVAHNPTEIGYLTQCRLLATKGLADLGLSGLVFLRDANGITPDDMPTEYKTMTGETDEN